jgi:hypothetical protein
VEVKKTMRHRERESFTRIAERVWRVEKRAGLGVVGEKKSNEEVNAG